MEIWRELGGLHLAIGDPIESESSYRQALEIALTRFGPGHPASTGVQRPLGMLLVQTGKLDEAERLLRTAHERLQARFGPEHPEVASSWQHLGRLSWEQGRLAQAQDAFQRSLQLVRRGNDLGPRTSVLCDLAQVRLALGVADGAELLALECQQMALSDGPVQAARADLLLARVAMTRGNSEAALSLLASAEQRLLSAGVSTGSDEHLPVALARTQLLIDVGNVPGADAALHALRNQPRIRGTATDAWDWRIGALQARLFCRQGRSGDGRELRQRVLAEAGLGQPERQRLADEIAELAAGCGRG